MINPVGRKYPCCNPAQPPCGEWLYHQHSVGTGTWHHQPCWEQLGIVSHLNRNWSTIITDYASVQHVTHLVILVGFEVGEWSAARGGEGHDFHASVHEAFVIQLLEDPPGKARDGALQLESQGLQFRSRPLCQRLKLSSGKEEGEKKLSLGSWLVRTT